jgi:ABC-2 type transport system ATP-binding protein
VGENLMEGWRVHRGRPAIVAEGLHKSYGKTRALDGLDLSVEEGTVLGLLGPNGAGKTTAVRILTTLLAPDAGRAEVAGLDVVRQAGDLRSRIGLTGQYAAVDEYLTGRENLEMVGRLYHLPKKQARRRADELLERFDLVDAAARLARTYSGGMRRRLDLAASLVLSPPVLFLDEPTTGLDPRSRIAMWDIIGELVSGGTTLLLTTQYLDEADRLADRIAVVDAGRVIAEGTSGELKARVGGESLDVTVARSDGLDDAARVLERYAHGDGGVRVDAQRRYVGATVAGGPGLLAAVVRDFDAAGVEVDELGLHRPTLDDVFLTLTGHAAEPEAEQRVDEKEIA